MTFDLAAYLERIGLDAVPAGAAGLAALQAGQMSAIAFENIDPLLARVPDLAPAAVWQKLVEAGRGGYCFELNGLLGQALGALGYDARPVLARVRREAAAVGPRSHLAWVVALPDGERLVDAGFGGPGPAEPLRLGVGAEQAVAGDTYRLRPDAESGETLVEMRREDGWSALYGFDRARVTEADVAAANFVAARWERAPFPRNLMLARQVAGGRVGLFNRAGRHSRGGEVETWTIASEDELARRLADDFGLAAAVPLVPEIWRRLPAA